MPQGDLPILAFNRGIISKLALARVDLNRTRMSAEVMTNLLPKTQGAMIIRPGTRYNGSSFNDTGAEFIEFVASTTDVALPELTHQKMRVWLPSDTGKSWETPVQSGEFVPLARPLVSTTLTILDTGWYQDNVGGGLALPATDIIPVMAAETTNGVQITAKNVSPNVNNWDGPGTISPEAWYIGDNRNESYYRSTGVGGQPWWVNIDFGSGNSKTVTSYTIRAASASTSETPKTWRLIRSQHDTGTYNTDTGKWTLEDERASETGWAASEQRSYTLSDTGTADGARHWRLHITANNGGTNMRFAELEMFEPTSVSGDTGQVVFNASGLRLNAGAVGSLARVRKQVVVDTGDQNIEHAIAMRVNNGPVVFRVGSSEGDDDYVSESELGTGYHNLAFTPEGNFHVTVQSAALASRNVSTLGIADSGTVEITTPWTASRLDSIRYDQSADVVYVDAPGIKPHKIERRGTGRSWSVVEYAPVNGPFRLTRGQSAKLSVAAKYGNTTMASDIPFFRSGHVGALFRLRHDRQDGSWPLGNLEAATDVVSVIGISDTGTANSSNERRLTVSVSGTWSGTAVVERSFTDPEFGFKTVTANYVTTGNATDTGTFSTTIDDDDDNITVYYRVRLSAYNSGTAVVTITYGSGTVSGIAKVTEYTDNQNVDVEVISRLSQTTKTKEWEEGSWSSYRGYPTSVALHSGRLAQSGKANFWASVSDDFENFDDTVEGEAAPLNRTLGGGAVDNVYFLLSLLRLVIGTAGAEIAVFSSATDDVLTATNSSARVFSTQGATDLRAVRMDNRGIFVQRSGQRVFMVGLAEDVGYANEYDSLELTLLAPDLLAAGVVSIAIQRQPDTRIHCALADGTVGILTYEPKEEVLAWSKWVTDTGSNSAVERVMVLPGTNEDKVFYHIRRTINGQTKRFLERWAMESECQGDTGLHWLMDCAVSHTDTGAATVISDFATHLGGQTIAAWANDTGQSNSYGKDLTPDDTGGDQVLLSLDTGGDLTLNDSGWKHVVGGLPYVGDFKSAKLAYAGENGTALGALKNVQALKLVASNLHNNAVYFGSDSGHLDPMPRVDDNGDTVDANKIYTDYDRIGIPFDGTWDEDSRVFLRVKAPRPATLMALVPRLTIND